MALSCSSRQNEGSSDVFRVSKKVEPKPGKFECDIKTIALTVFESEKGNLGSVLLVKIARMKD